MISVVIPAYHAEATIARSVRSVLAQTIANWETIIVADDDCDYAALLFDFGIDDPRLRFVSTGRIGSGPANARNIGSILACGDFIAALDADDVFLPSRFECLLPLASEFGAAADNSRVIDDATDQLLYHAFDNHFTRGALGIWTLFETTVPLFPLVARRYVERYPAGIDFAEDVVSNLRLIDRIGALPVIGECHSEYRVISGSLCHNDSSVENFEKSYTDLIARFSSDDWLGLSPASAAAAREGFLRKRDFNRAFAAARKNNPTLDFQTFAARRRESVLLA